MFIASKGGRTTRQLGKKGIIMICTDKKRQQTKIQNGRPAGGGGMKIRMSSLDHEKG